ncbi:MAG: A/G-specific adenine glycosylase [Pseudomonadota bacterium]
MSQGDLPLGGSPDGVRDDAPKGTFSERLLAWFDQHGRHDLPWQHDRTAYRVWVSEIMLQQTQVTTVIPYFERFMASFPDVAALAAANIDDVLHHWSGLGYYARGRNLHKAAQAIVSDHNGACPDSAEAWEALPGVGRSTAAAIVAQAFGKREAILDGNVKRVLTRYHGVRGWPGKTDVEKALWEHAWEHTPHERLCDYTQAIMDLGATACTRRNPRCTECPLRADCVALRDGLQHELPERKPKKPKPVRTTTMLIVRADDGRILLEQRPPSGIWGGLWSLPEAGEKSAEAWCDDALGVTPEVVSTLGVLRHTFSHFHLDITPVIASVDRACAVEDTIRVWYNPDAPAALGLAAPVRQLIDEARHDPNR